MLESVQPFFSIIIPVYNSSKYIEKCIDSILRQKFVDFEVILIDDGSTDDSVEIISKYLKKYSFLKLIRQRNNGVSAARNRGLKNAKGKYVLFMDSDDYWINETMPKLYRLLLSNESVDILFFNYLESSNQSQITHAVLSKFLKKRMSQNIAIESVLSNKGYLGYCWNKVFKKSSIQNYRFDESVTYLEDMLFNVSCILNVNEIMSIDDCLYAYNLRSDSVVNIFKPKNMTFFNSLDKVGEIIPDKFHDAIVIKRKFAYIEFASKFIFKNQKEYKFFKNKFDQEKKIFRLKRFGLGKQELITLSFGNINFTVSVIVLQLIKLIKKVMKS